MLLCPCPCSICTMCKIKRDKKKRQKKIAQKMPFFVVNIGQRTKRNVERETRRNIAANKMKVSIINMIKIEKS